MEIEELTNAVLRRSFIPIEASGRHVHVTADQARRLFGHSLTPQRPLSQPGQYLARERVTIIGPKGRFENVAVLGPERDHAQVEVSFTDGRSLGVLPPVRPSGSVEDSPGIRLVGPSGEITLEQGVIAAQRHIHMTPADAARFHVKDRQMVRLETFTDRPVVFEDVLVRVNEAYATAAHLDYDEANACGLQGETYGRILP